MIFTVFQYVTRVEFRSRKIAVKKIMFFNVFFHTKLVFSAFFLNIENVENDVKCPCIGKIFIQCWVKQFTFHQKKWLCWMMRFFFCRVYLSFCAVLCSLKSIVSLTQQLNRGQLRLFWDFTFVIKQFSMYILCLPVSCLFSL